MIIAPRLVDSLFVHTDTAMPIYRQLEDQVAAMIAAGTLPVGFTMPAERQLSADLGVSRTTIQRAYDALRKRKLLAAHGRLGHVVQDADPVLGPALNRLRSFTEEMEELGRKPSSRVVERLVVANRSIASIFGRPSTTMFLNLIRIRYGDDVPLAREVAWYDLECCPSLAEADVSGSIYSYLADNGVPLGHCEKSIEATSPSAEECAVFGFAEPRPCLLIKCRSFDRQQRMVEYVESLFRGDGYAYRLELKA